MIVPQIEKGVPPPSELKGPPRKYPFGRMEVGDSFSVPPGPDAKRAMYAASAFGRTHSLRFVTRTQEDGSVRVWRVE